jgi:type I site-specific restriction-modification system R (restriction) subunit
MPHLSGLPLPAIELTDKSTQAVFSSYISLYDNERAVMEMARMSIYYENRLAKLALDEAEKHYNVARSWEGIFEQSPSAKVISLTASHFRGNGREISRE